MNLSQAIRLAVTAVMSPLGVALAGPENSLLIIDPANRESMYAGNHYRHVRGIPDANVIYFRQAANNHAGFVATNLKAVGGTLVRRDIGDHIDYMIVTPGGPYFVTASSTIADGCAPVTRFSASSVYTMAQIAQEVLAGGSSTSPNHFAGATTINFDSGTSYLLGAPSLHQNARRYYIGAMLGYLGERGNTIVEVIDMIDRSAAADGTRPAGTFYFMDNQADPARNVRSPQFPAAVNAITTLGYGATILAGVLPGGNHDALGIMTGASAPNITGANFSILPGAFCDHLTSFAGAFNVASQVKMSAWIAKGASGSVGAIEEPCNYTGKFPAAAMHVHYARGATLGEAYFRSAEFIPYQALLYGDPLTRPFAHIPSVNIPNAPTQPVSGSIQLTPTGTTTRPSTIVDRFELFIDGVSQGVLPSGFAFNVDTTTLADGWHDLRAVGFDNSTLRTQGRWIGSLITNNHARSASVVLGPTSGDLGTAFRFFVDASGGAVREYRLMHNGRVIGARTDTGPIWLWGQTIGAGVSHLSVEVEFTDGRLARSQPVEVDIAFAGGGGNAMPTSFDYVKRVPGSEPFVVELPATFDADPSTAVYTIVSHPAQSTRLYFDGAAYVLYEPDQGAAGSDTLRFHVQTAGGTSRTATVTLIYSEGCYADCDPSTGVGVLDIFDFLCFGNRFSASEPYACDCDTSTGPGVCDIFDFLCYGNAFSAGCP